MIRTTTHCDRPGCNTHAQTDLAKTAGFLTVEWHDDFLHYCSVDCLLIGMANFPGPTTIETTPS